MNVKKPHFINFGGSLMDVSTPRVMGILNVTPDSFYSGSRTQTSKQIAERVEQLRNEGADIIDIGACSTRPGSEQPTIDEEMNRLQMGLKVAQDVWPEAILSVDTYRSKVAQVCVEKYGVAMVNDIAAGQMDEEMFPTVARLGVPYVLMHMQGTPDTMQVNPHYTDVVDEVVTYLARRSNELHDRGVADVIVDPGFGFGKTLEHNYELMSRLEELHLLEMPLLVGISRKSMVYRLLGVTPEEALNGTTALNTIALMKGAHILRVHDVKACRQCIDIVDKLRNNS
jgi:dihydropteroate synthase